MALQAETAWNAAAVQLEALRETHDGVLNQLKEAQERTELAEQETIEVSHLVHFSLQAALSDVLSVSARWQCLPEGFPVLHTGKLHRSLESNNHLESLMARYVICMMLLMSR